MIQTVLKRGVLVNFLNIDWCSHKCLEREFQGYRATMDKAQSLHVWYLVLDGGEKRGPGYGGLCE